MKLTQIQIIFLIVGAVVLVSLGVLVGYFIVKSKSKSNCIPDCKNKKCGDSDGCDGKCSYCDNNLTCNLKGECVPGGSTPTPDPPPCVPNCTNKYCGDSDECGSQCTTCEDKSTPFCNTSSKTCQAIPPRPIKPPENSLYNTLSYPSGEVDDPITDVFPAVVCDNLTSSVSPWPPSYTQKISTISGTLSFGNLITEQVYNMMFPYHYKTYSYNGLTNALAKHPEGWRLGGEGDDNMRRRDIAAFFANCAHEVSNGNGPSVLQNTSLGNGNNGPWSKDGTYFGDVWGQKYFKCYCGGGVSGQDCDPKKYGDWTRNTLGGTWCGSNIESNVWKSSDSSPTGWVGGMNCVLEGCPEYPPGTGTPTTNNYCTGVGDQDFIKNWKNKYPNDEIYGGSTDPPCSEDHPCPCYGSINDPKRYYGRGPIQLSYNFNYGEFSLRMNQLGITQQIFGANDDYYLLKNPDLIKTNETIIWLSAVDFWCSNRSTTYNMISCHDAMILGADRTDHGFGLAVNIVNGGCSSLKQIIASVGQPYRKASDDNANRAQWYQVFTYAFGITP